jgi:uracil-DNA glycosylase
MESLQGLLDSIKQCNACGLMSENKAIGIRYVPILPKPDARIVFVGRDPNPRTAQEVGCRGGKSVFINTLFDIVDKARVSEQCIYITDLCKCHWRTSVGKPLPLTEYRSAKLDVSKAHICLNQWLVREIEILKPRLLVAFGEELYQLLRPLIVNPAPPPMKLSAKADKSVLDAEYWFVNNGTLTLSIGDKLWPLAILRHPGNSARLPQSSKTDLRLQIHKKATKQVIELVRAGCA